MHWIAAQERQAEFDRSEIDHYNDSQNYGARRETVMHTPGIIRKVDSLGRVVLPGSFRKSLNIERQDLVEIFIEGNRMILQKFQPACVFCGSAEGLMCFQEKNVCRACIQKIKEY